MKKEEQQGKKRRLFDEEGNSSTIETDMNTTVDNLYKRCRKAMTQSDESIAKLESMPLLQSACASATRILKSRLSYLKALVPEESVAAEDAETQWQAHLASTSEERRAKPAEPIEHVEALEAFPALKRHDDSCWISHKQR